TETERQSLSALARGEAARTNFKKVLSEYASEAARVERRLVYGTTCRFTSNDRHRVSLRTQETSQ
ncbi:MAG: hypothetical protein M3R67_14620, partial [Acidobacteriota bacterium]|nr:hypothetical protein [Acidobacteriota bacterium]